MKKQILLILLIAPAFLVLAQQKDTANYPYWIDMMQDPEANFFETQKAFEMYWDGRERDKGDGWKVFKRWEWFMEQRVDENGKKPTPGHVLKEYAQYFSGTSKAAIGAEEHWNEIGPVNLPINGTGQPNGLGRINAIAFHPSNQNILYAGAPSGGLWKTYNGGTTWEPMTDTLPTLGISSIVVDYSDPDIVYIGTGDRDGGDAPGLGVWKSTDAGETWNASNSGMGNRVVGKMLMNPLDSMTLLAATSGGIYRSVNGGQSWSRVSSNTIHYKDLVYKPGDTATVYATATGDFYRSTDGGRNWSMISSGLPGSTRAVIGVSADDPDYVYVLQTNQRTFKGLYRSTNSGASFSLQSNSPNIMDYSSTGSGSSGQAWYNLCIAVDPNDVDVIYVGGINIFKSTNGGVTWSINAHWVGSGAPDIHADQHVMEVSPINDRLYVGNDGGVYYTSNGGSTWPDISSGLAVAQIYKIGQSAQSRNLVINGYQDNGTAIYDGSWRTEIGGDGMECIVDPSDSMYMYGALYYGSIRRSTNYGIWFSTISGSISETGEWITPYILKEDNSNTMFGGYKNIWKSTNVKSGTPTWTRISNALGGTNSQGIRVLENSPANTDILYFAREDRTLWRSDDINAASPSYTNLTSGLPTNNWPRDIEAHPTDSNTVYIVQSNNVYQSTNKGVSWTDISGTLPNVSMNCIVYDTSSNGDLYVGSDLGVFFKGSWMTDWAPFNGGLPYAPEVTELEIYYNDDPDLSRIKAATYGRGLWSSPLYKTPIADFDAQIRDICPGDSIAFSDESTGFYTDVLWTFVGGSPSASADPNPTVTYSSPGLYNVRLQVSNSIETKQTLKTGFVRVDSLPVVTVNPDSASILIGDSVTLTALGSVYFDWSPVSWLDKISGSPVVASPPSTVVYTIKGTNEYCKPDDVIGQVYVEVVDPGANSVKEIAFANSYLRVYPNPVNDFLILEFRSEPEKNFSADLFDLSGKLIGGKTFETVSGSNRFEYDVRKVKSGIHLLRLYSDNEHIALRILIDHSF